MLKLSRSLALPLLLCSTAFAAQPVRPQIPALDGPTITRECDAVIAKATAFRTSIEQGRQRPVLEAMNRLTIITEDLDGPISLLSNVSPDAATRAAGEACTLKLSAFYTDTAQSDALYRRLKSVSPGDRIDAAMKQQYLDDFEDSGITLDAARRARVKAISTRLTDIGQQFQKNISEDPTSVVMTADEVAGLPESWKAARKRDDQGRYLLDLSNPVVYPFMDAATNAEARRRLWIARTRLGGQANLALLDESVALRSEMAKLYGYPDFATYQLRRRMAGTPKAVDGFLDGVERAVTQAEIDDIAGLRAAKATMDGTPLDATTLNRWDVSFVAEAVRKQRFSVDQEALRKYFPSEASLAYTMRIASTLYDIRFAPRTVQTWHPDVRYFDVFENDHAGRPGQFIGGIYLDLFPRPDKYNHAAAWGVFRESKLARRTPVSVLVTNFDRDGLNQEELETMLHEFGHVMHGVLSTARHVDLAGTSVRRDFVEAPSQMFEEWARRPEALRLFAEVCKDCPQLSADQIAQLDAARKFDRGLAYAGQWQLATYDMRLQTGSTHDALATWVELMRSRPLGYVADTWFPASFGHVVNGYAAGYYGYMWSEVLALDMLSAFHGQLLDPAVGKRYREIILAPGGEQPPMELVTRFLGRAPNSDAFFAEVAGKR